MQINTFKLIARRNFYDIVGAGWNDRQCRERGKTSTVSTRDPAPWGTGAKLSYLFYRQDFAQRSYGVATFCFILVRLVQFC